MCIIDSTFDKPYNLFKMRLDLAFVLPRYVRYQFCQQFGNLRLIENGVSPRINEAQAN